MCDLLGPTIGYDKGSDGQGERFYFHTRLDAQPVYNSFLEGVAGPQAPQISPCLYIYQYS